MKKKIFSLMIAVVFLSVISPLSATTELYQNYTDGGRVLGMGGAFVGLADDIYSLVYNPAGLANVKGININANYQPEFAVDDISKMTFLSSINLGLLTVGASFYQLGQEEGLKTTKIALGIGMGLKDLKLGPLYNLKFGLGANLYLLSVDGYYPDASEGFSNNPITASVGVGFLFNLFSDKLSVGGYWNNINSPTITFYEGTEGDSIDSDFCIGASYLVNKYFRVSADYQFSNYEYSSGVDSFSAGAEIYFYDAVMLRFGMDGGKMTIGMGVKSGMLDFNMATRVEEDLNMYYQFDVTIKIK